jgi:hypothetical protein
MGVKAGLAADREVAACPNPRRRSREVPNEPRRAFDTFRGYRHPEFHIIQRRGGGSCCPAR